MRATLIALLASVAIASPAPADEGALPKEFEAIETIVVVFLENRSFVNLLPSFPGALGIAQAAPEAILQRDRDGSILPHLPPVWESGAKTPDPAYPASMPNAPFAIDEKPYDRPGSVLTVSPVHRFYQNRMQINDGKNDMFVAWTDAGSLVMGPEATGGGPDRAFRPSSRRRMPKRDSWTTRSTTRRRSCNSFRNASSSSSCAVFEPSSAIFGMHSPSAGRAAAQAGRRELAQTSLPHHARVPFGPATAMG